MLVNATWASKKTVMIPIWSTFDIKCYEPEYLRIYQVNQISTLLPLLTCSCSINKCCTNQNTVLFRTYTNNVRYSNSNFIWPTILLISYFVYTWSYYVLLPIWTGRCCMPKRRLSQLGWLVLIPFVWYLVCITYVQNNCVQVFVLECSMPNKGQVVFHRPLNFSFELS